MNININDYFILDKSDDNNVKNKVAEVCDEVPISTY